MEKQRIKSAVKSCRRLLAFLLTSLCCANLFSQRLTASMIQELSITPVADQKLYAKEDLKFEVFIPYVKSNQVTIQSPAVQSNVSFKQIKKSDDFVNNGVKLELWFNFQAKGDYALKPLSVIIQNRERKISFAPVQIVDNPADMLPRVVVEFSNGTILYSDEPAQTFTATAGEVLHFTVYLQYAVQLIQFNFDIPKNSIFKQTKLYEITEIKYREKNYSDELIPVANFDWTGLVAGKSLMPPLKLQVTGYNGYRNEVIMPEVEVEFTAPEEKLADEVENSIFDDAFDFGFEEADGAKKLEITEEVCKKLAQYRKDERNQLLNHRECRQKRLNFENELQLPVTSSEFFMGVYYFAIIVLIVLIIFLVSLIRKNRRNAVVFVAALTICAIAFFTYSHVKKSENYGIFKGGKVTSIPEENAESFSELPAGNRVHIIEQAGKWYYVELGETGGWCLATDVIVIK